MNITESILQGKTSLGIEFGSTNIKAVLIDENNNAIASGSHAWENRLENGIWTYSLDDIWTGIRDCYANLVAKVKEKTGIVPTTYGAIGISAMMHGYMPFDENDNLLVPFRTWRNTITAPAAKTLSELFDFNIPQRWSIAHLMQAILNGEEHVADIRFMTTLEGYVHYMLTGSKVIGVGEASGMFPVDPSAKDYDAEKVAKFDALIADRKFPWTLRDILPKVLVAGEQAGVLTEAGAKLLDPTGTLRAGIPLCPPEGDAETGMTATNSVCVRTGNISAGTSVFAMIVLEKPLKRRHEELDIVMTPDGAPVAMVHGQNCTSDLNAWVSLFDEFAKLFGLNLNPNELYGSLYRKAMEGDADCGGVLAYNYFSGEHIVGLEEGRPMFVRKPDANFTLANFMRANLFSAMSVLKIGLDILLKEENVVIDRIFGHGGIFKTKGVAQNLLASAIQTPVSVMETAGEGGAWGIALLASYMIHKAEGETLPEYLNQKVFAGLAGEEVLPNAKDVEGFERWIQAYSAVLPAERAAVETMR